MLLAARAPTSSIRMLPDFLIIGAQRCGTSSLYKYLGHHSSIAPSVRKEVAYFSRYFDKGIGWYRSNFPTVLYKSYKERVRRRPLLTFEATPDYVFHPLTPARIAEVLPGVKIIVLLRNPIDRAFSHFEAGVRLGFETLSFDEAIALEPVRLAGEVERMHEDPRYRYADSNYRRYSYVARGMYAEQLRRWMRLFPRAHFCFIESTRLFSRPSEAYSAILEFLGLPIWLPKAFKNYSYRSGERVRCSQMSDQTRTLLARTFEPHNQELYDLIGVRFDWRG